MDPNSPEAMAKALSGQPDPYEGMFGSPPQGNVAGSLLGAAKNWWQSGQSWPERMHQATQNNDLAGQIGLLQGLAGPAALKLVPYLGAGEHVLTPEFHSSMSSRPFHIVNESGDIVGHTSLSRTLGRPQDVHVNWIGPGAYDSDFYNATTNHDILDNANTLGPKEIRSLIPEVQREFPNTRYISGERVTGARRNVWDPEDQMVRIKIPKSR